MIKTVNEKNSLTDFCSLCGSGDVRRLFSAIDHQYKIEGIFSVARCARCGLIALNPMPTLEEVHRYYAVEDLYSYSPITIDLSRRLKNRLLSRGAAVYFRNGNSFLNKLERLCFLPVKKRLIPRSPYGGRLLDVGCGNGAYLLNQREIGWEVYGCELSESGVRAARQHQLDVFRGTLTEANYLDAFFDVVRLEQVFEHIADPTLLFGEIRRILKPSGILIIGVPNGNALTFRIFNRHWGLLGVPFHLFQYSSSSLEKVLEKNGFQVEQYRFLPYPICWIWSMNNVLNAMFNTHREVGFINNTLPRSILKLFFLPLSYLVHFFRPGWSEVMEVYAVPSHVD